MFACYPSGKRRLRSFTERLQHYEHESEDNAYYCDRRNRVSFIAKVISNCATRGGYQILPKMISRRFLSRSLQKQHNEPRENQERDPVKRSMQGGISLE